MNPIRFQLMYGYIPRVIPPLESTPTLSKAAGEGSRGGKVVGHTRTGKPIYDSKNHDAHDTFTREEHKDVEAKHKELETGQKPYPQNLKRENQPTVAQQRKTFMPPEGPTQSWHEDTPARVAYKNILSMFKRKDMDFQGHITFDPKQDEIRVLTDTGRAMVRQIIADHQAAKKV